MREKTSLKDERIRTREREKHRLVSLEREVRTKKPKTRMDPSTTLNEKDRFP